MNGAWAVFVFAAGVLILLCGIICRTKTRGIYSENAILPRSLLLIGLSVILFGGLLLIEPMLNSAAADNNGQTVVDKNSGTISGGITSVKDVDKLNVEDNKQTQHISGNNSGSQHLGNIEVSGSGTAIGGQNHNITIINQSPPNAINLEAIPDGGTTDKVSPFDDKQYTQGWEVKLYTIPKGFEVKSDPLPKTPRYIFIATKSAFTFNDIKNYAKIKDYKDVALFWQGSGLLEVKNAGEYVINLDLDIAPGRNMSSRPSMYGAILIEGEIKQSGLGQAVNLEAVQYLKEGIYPIELHIAGTLERNGEAMKKWYFESSLNATITGPNDASPQPIHKVLLTKKRTK